MFKLDLDPLAPRLLKNRDAHIDYLKHTQEQDDILRGIVKQAKAKQPLDYALNFTCKHVKRIQELLTYVRDTCPNAFKLSEKKVAVTPMNKVKKVSFLNLSHPQATLNSVSDLVMALGRGRIKEDLESSTWRRRQDFNATRFRVDAKRKSIKDNIHREKVFEVDEALNIESSSASSFQVMGINVDETKVNAVRDWSSLKILPEEDHGNMMWTLHTKKLKSKTLATLVASPNDFQAKRKETGVSYALVVKGVKDVMDNAIPIVIKPLLAEFGKIVKDDTPDALAPLRNIQHQIDLSRKTTLLVSISNEVFGFDSIKELYENDEDYGNI
nr:DNA/RNA polymerases superfamily protein [Tanacetum cinerariifolium]